MGVIPKRTEDLVDQRPSRVDKVTSGRWVEPRIPEPARGWHKTALKIWNSFKSSGQVDFWQSTDWAVAYSICEDLSNFKQQEVAVRLAVRDVKAWDKHAAHLERDERVAAGYPAVRPSVPRAGSPQKMAEIYRVLGTLLVTEADRRRVHIELDAAALGDDVDPVADVLQQYAAGLKGD